MPAKGRAISPEGDTGMLVEYSVAAKILTSTISPGRIGPLPSPAPTKGPLVLDVVGFERPGELGVAPESGKIDCGASDSDRREELADVAGVNCCWSEAPELELESCCARTGAVERNSRPQAGRHVSSR